MKNNKRIEFAPSEHNKLTLVPSKYYLNDVEVSQLEFYNITIETTLEEVLDQEPFNYSEYAEWETRVNLVKHLINNQIQTEYTCENEICRKYYLGCFNNGFCGCCSDDE